MPVVFDACVFAARTYFHQVDYVKRNDWCNRGIYPSEQLLGEGLQVGEVGDVNPRFDEKVL